MTGWPEYIEVEKVRAAPVHSPVWDENWQRQYLVVILAPEQVAAFYPSEARDLALANSGDYAVMFPDGHRAVISKAEFEEDYHSL